MEEQYLAETTTGLCVGAVLDELGDEYEDDEDAFSVSPTSLPRSSPPPAATPPHSSPAKRAGRASAESGAAAPAADGGVVLKCERQAEEWHFDETAHAAKVAQLKYHCTELKDREARARSRVLAADQDAEDHVQRVLSSAEQEEQERARRLADLRAELVELRDQEEQLREDCQQEVVRLEREVEAERAHRCRVEEELRREPRNQAAAKQRVEELQDAEYQQAREKDEQIRKQRASAHREVLEVQRAAQEQARDIERRMQLDLAIIKRELDEVLCQAQGAVQVAVQDRRKTQEASAGEVSKVDRQILQSLNGTHKQLLELQDSALQQAKEVQARDLALEALLYDHTDAALASLGCAGDEKRQANMLEHEHRQRTSIAVKALGETFPRSTQYQLHLDKKTRSAVLAASAYAVVSGSKEMDSAPASAGGSPWQTRSRLQAGDEGRSYGEVFAELAAA